MSAFMPQKMEEMNREPEDPIMYESYTLESSKSISESETEDYKLEELKPPVKIESKEPTDVPQMPESSMPGPSRRLSKEEMDEKYKDDPRYIAMKKRDATIHAGIDSLVHSITCRTAKKCRRPDCFKMKKVRQHMKTCKTRLNSECRICKQYTIICCYHSSICHQDGCTIPFCTEVRKYLGKKEPKMIVDDMVKSHGFV